MFVRNVSFFLGALLFIAACGGTTGVQDTGLKLSGLAYTEVGTTNKLTHSGSSVSGDGVIRFAAQMPGGQANKVSFDFSIADGGMLVLTMNSGSDLLSGISLDLRRTGNVLSRATISSNAGATTLVPEVMRALDASKPMQLTMHVHNDEVPAHIIITNKAGDAIYFNAQPGHQGDTKDAFFGFDLRNATVTAVSVAKDDAP